MDWGELSKHLPSSLPFKYLDKFLFYSFLASFVSTVATNYISNTLLFPQHLNRDRHLSISFHVVTSRHIS